MADAEAAPVADSSAPEAVEVAEQEVQAEGEVQPEAQPEVQPEPAKEELKQEVKSQLKKLKIKVDGKELEKELDLANEAELIKILQMSEMSNKRAQEAAELRKKDNHRENELKNFLELLEKQPELVLSKMGKNPAELAEKWLQAEVEKMQMDPKERRIQELEAEMKRVQEEKAQVKKAQEEAQARAVREKYAADYEKELSKAITDGNLPNEPHIIAKLTDYMALAIKEGVDLSFSDLIPLVQNNQKNTIKNALKGMKADDLIQLLSEQTINDLIIKKTPKKEKKVAPPTAQAIKDAGEPKDDNTGPRLRNQSASDFFRNLTMQYAGKE